MKINLQNIDTEEFITKQDSNGNTLVTPKISCHWNADNLIFRSSMWNPEGQLISAGFKKFFNWNEHPELNQIGNDLSNASIIEKIDGSCLIVSKYNNELIIRTRGSFEARRMDNGDEIDYFIEKYPLAFENSILNTHSLIFEWTSPKNVIVINYGNTPELYLTGCIDHSDYTYLTQNALDVLGMCIKVKRPKRFNFNNPTGESVKSIIESSHDGEGVCVYYNNDQNIRKLKSSVYLAQHAFKNNADIEYVIDMYLEYFYPDLKGTYNEFVSKLEEHLDWECMQLILPFVSKIFEYLKEVRKIVEGMHGFIDKIKSLETRKEQALQIINSYGKTNRASMLFTLLDNKELTKDNVKKLIFQCI